MVVSVHRTEVALQRALTSPEAARFCPGSHKALRTTSFSALLVVLKENAVRCSVLSTVRAPAVATESVAAVLQLWCFSHCCCIRQAVIEAEGPHLSGSCVPGALLLSASCYKLSRANHENALVLSPFEMRWCEPAVLCIGQTPVDN